MDYQKQDEEFKKLIKDIQQSREKDRKESEINAAVFGVILLFLAISLLFYL